jgi:tRNA/rRNA methyltransferase
MVFGYEWWLARQGELPVRELQTNETSPATKAELDNFMDHLIRECDAAGFLKNEQKRPGMVRNLRHFFTRGEVTRQELNTLHGVVSELVRGRKK